jgi:anaerobic magnesium-protoporphyrin IX monomethyl ester cyclase
MRAQTAVLVGPSLQGNLALEYLGAAAEAAGHRARLVSFDSKAQAAACVRSILELEPDLVGLSIAFQCAVEDHVELARLLRHAGYRGHLTCGGHVPTFCYRELLEAAPGIDSVVRHEGEGTLVELLDALGRGEVPRGLNGLVWRDGAKVEVAPPRPLLADLDALPTPLRRQRPLVVGGAPIAVMLTSRGCIGECTYCCLRAFGKDAGGRRFRLRGAEAVADEIATAYHDLGVRVIILQDDLFIVPSERRSIERMNAISRALEARGVGKVLFWIKGRPETITPAVAEAAAAMGAIHMFLGVENAAPERLRYLGRVHTREDNERAISRCLERGIRSSYNFMLFDPDCTLEEIGANIDFASRRLDLTWNVCRTEIYPGTPLLERLRAEGRLEGSWLAYGYTMRDPRAELMFRVLRICFAERAFSNESLLNRLINLSFARHVHEALLPGPATAAMSAEVDRLVGEVYADTVEELRRVAAFAARADADDVAACRDFAVETAMAINGRDNLRSRRIDEIGFLLDARGARIRAAV